MIAWLAMVFGVLALFGAVLVLFGEWLVLRAVKAVQRGRCYCGEVALDPPTAYVHNVTDHVIHAVDVCQPCMESL